LPNWSENELIVDGGQTEIARFKELAKGKVTGIEPQEETDLSLNSLYPMPKELEGTKAPPDQPKQSLIDKYGSDNWYDWHVKNWGTKWDVEARLETDKRNRLRYFFDSAWSPPLNWLIKVSKDFPTLKFTIKYIEEGMGFKGTFTVKNGETLNDVCHGG